MVPVVPAVWLGVVTGGDVFRVVLVVPDVGGFTVVSVEATLVFLVVALVAIVVAPDFPDDGDEPMPDEVVAADEVVAKIF